MGASESKADGSPALLDLLSCFEECGQKPRATNARLQNGVKSAPRSTRLSVVVPQQGVDSVSSESSPKSQAKILSFLDMGKKLTAQEERTLGMKLSALHYEERERICCRSTLRQEQRKRLCDAVEEFYTHWGRLSQAEQSELIVAEKLTKDEEMHIGFLESEATLANFLNLVKRSKAMRMSPTIRSPELPSSPTAAMTSSRSPRTRTQSRSVSPTIKSSGGSADSPGGSGKNTTLASKGRTASNKSKGVPESQLSSFDGGKNPLAAKGRVGSNRGAGRPFTAESIDSKA